MRTALPPQAVDQCLRALGGDAWKIEVLVAERDNSRIHHARSGSRGVAIKECVSRVTREPDSVAAEGEFAALAMVAERTRELGVDPLAPMPLVLCREHAAYAMTWAPGRTATELVLAPSTNPKEAASLGEAAGDWLRRFHACKALPARPNEFLSHLEYVDHLAKEAGRQEPILTRAASILVEFASSAATQRMPASWIHGDMKSDNLLVDEGKVTGLDLQLSNENTVAYDLAPFLNHLRLLRWSPRGVGRGRQLDRMAEGFLRGYSPEMVDWALPLLWLRCYLLMQTVASSKRSSHWRALVARWPARRELARTIAELQSCH